MLDCAAQNQIAKTVQELKLIEGSENGLPVLGLARCHGRKQEKDIAGTQAGVPICITRSKGVFVGSGPK